MAVGEELVCARQGCVEPFVSKTHNQKYHDDECCRLATNAKIMQKYYDKKARKEGKERRCGTCSVKLSAYNPDTTCNSCQQRSEKARNDNTKQLLSAIIW